MQVARGSGDNRHVGIMYRQDPATILRFPPSDADLASNPYHSVTVYRGNLSHFRHLSHSAKKEGSGDVENLVGNWQKEHKRNNILP